MKVAVFNSTTCDCDFVAAAQDAVELHEFRFLDVNVDAARSLG
jgi:hypothetical protein